MAYIIVAKSGRKVKNIGTVGTKRDATKILSRGRRLNKGKNIKFLARKV